MNKNELAEAIARFFKNFDGDGNWADHLDTYLEEQGYDVYVDDDLKADISYIVSVDFDGGTYHVYDSDESRPQSDPQRYFIEET